MGVLPSLIWCHQAAMEDPCRFYLGTHMVGWMRLLDVPLFVSRRRLAKVNRPRRSEAAWALDSGGFTELSKFGRWTVTPEQYADEASLWSEKVGQLEWAAIQDWMCEPHITAMTGMTVQEHQERTIASYFRLRELAPSLPWVPVIQGFRADDYFDHVEQYRAAGVDLATLPLVGLGSVCRRQAMLVVEEIARDLCALGIRLHAFGLKKEGLVRAARYLVSADSMAWSKTARTQQIRLPGCQHAKCSNCIRWALKWRSEVLDCIQQGLTRSLEPSLF